MRLCPHPVRTASVVLLTALAGACSRPDIEFVDPWIPAAPPNVTVFAGYFELHNNTSDPIVLVSANAPDFSEIEIHRSVEENGIARMIRQDAVPVPSNATRQFAPGGYHLMFIDPKGPVAEGNSIPVELSFEGRAAVVVDFTVRRMSMDL